jgi:hypothetical protein
MTLPFQGPDKLDCPCGCGLFGTPVRRARGDGLRHVRGCPCRRCKASRVKPRARRRENRVAKDLGGTRDIMSGAITGADVTAGLWSFEETSNVALVRGLRRWWESKQIRTKMARLEARPDLHAFVASWDGRPQLVVSPYEDFTSAFPHQTIEATK